ncbi:MAG: hypothetical protein WBA45_14985 [Microthrixaceae bacterium]
MGKTFGDMPKAWSWAPWLKRISISLLVLGTALAFAPVVAIDGVCVFVPCSPLAGSVAFAETNDGQVSIETGPLTADALRQLQIVEGEWPASEDRVVLWGIERTDDVDEDWVGPVTVGATPAGFTETTDLRLPLPERWSVFVSNGCYGREVALPSSKLSTLMVTYEEGDTDSLEAFHAQDMGFSSCEEARSARVRVATLIGLGLGLVGLLGLLTALSIQLIAGRRSQTTW